MNSIHKPNGKTRKTRRKHKTTERMTGVSLLSFLKPTINLPKKSIENSKKLNKIKHFIRIRDT